MNPIDSSQPSLPPGEFGLPVIGETLKFFRDAKFAQKRHQQYGDVFKTRLLGSPTIFMRGVEANQFVLMNSACFEVTWPPSTRALLGPLSLALQTGDLHQKRRKLLAQAFSPRSLSGYIAAIETITQQYAQRWQQAPQGELTWYPELRRYTFDVACKLLVGLDGGSDTRLGHAFEVWCEGLFSIPLSLPWTRFGRAQRERNRLLQDLEHLIRQRQQHPSSSEDALGLLIQAEDEAGDRLSLEELKDQILLLLFAGHETLTSAIASFCLLMAQHPEVMAKIRAEQRLFADRPLTLENLRQMTYLEQVLREVLRLVPPVGVGFRKVIADCEFNGYQIPQGWNVLYQIAATHSATQLYPQPDAFDPDRFSPENLQNQTVDRQKYGYLPFGGGIRECIGKEFARLEMKIFAVHLARGYNWSLLPDQDLTLITVPTPHPKDGLRVRFTCDHGLN
ncbi:MAG: cytochrome P450 [Drouetiella hepatica Uher 2000/2452]|jgi:cytochrome P450|uniref:Cytochrome P450 n=1 Tax=Drouetiella hepatica Uher 2000/2452 TaxID=904376 RepID=A0A951UM93_9CYAN|nr:cytochrome P450 [Drouetiella hepatica Uher 2000/2452]